MNKILLLSVISLWGIHLRKASPQTFITTQYLGLQLNKCNIDKSKLYSDMKDSIIKDNFNYGDNYLYIELLTKSRNEIMLYKICINGPLTAFRTNKLTKSVKRIDDG